MLNYKKQILVLSFTPLIFSSFLPPDNNLNIASSASNNHVLAQHEMSLDNRYQDKFVNDIFRNNILLNLAYLDGRVNSAKDVKWDKIIQPFQYEFTLNPDKTFAFHEDVKENYQGKVEKTTNARFNATDGFKTDGYLFGDGVCHLASLINWVAKEAGLLVEAPTKHDFANIPDIPKEYGVSIYKTPGSKTSNALQNLYITNNKTKPVSFKFEYQNNKIKVSVIEQN